MSRESCITHSPKQAIAIVRQDYYQLMERDACAAALLNLFEYWANAAISADDSIERPWIGARPIREFEQMMLGIATDKQIRKRIALLEARGFIRTQAPAKRGSAKSYQVLVPEIQQALVGHLTEGSEVLRSNNPSTFGQMTEAPSVKQPIPLRSNDRALKNKTQEFKKEDLKEAPFSLPNAQQSAARRAASMQANDLAEGEQSKAEQNEQRAHAQAGLVPYTQPPETIDLADFWASNPGMAKARLRFIAPGHKRLEMVAHGFGQWWIGPGLNDFDEFLIKACQQRKRKLEQPDSVADAKTFINNLIRKGNWANFSLRCDEAEELRDSLAERLRQRATVAHRTINQTAAATSSPVSNLRHTTLARAQAEQRQAAIGLAKFKVSKGDIKKAKEIADHLGIAYSDIGVNSPVKQLVTA